MYQNGKTNDNLLIYLAPIFGGKQPYIGEISESMINYTYHGLYFYYGFFGFHPTPGSYV